MGAAAASKQETGSVMSTVGQIEKRTQARVVQLFQNQLGYDHLGNWIDRVGNANIEPTYLRPFLEAKGYAHRRLQDSMVLCPRTVSVFIHLRRVNMPTNLDLDESTREAMERLICGSWVWSSLGR